MATPFAPTTYSKATTAKKGAEVAGSGAAGLIAAQAILLPFLHQFDWYDPSWDQTILGITGVAFAAVWRAWTNWRKNKFVI